MQAWFLINDKITRCCDLLQVWRFYVCTADTRLRFSDLVRLSVPEIALCVADSLISHPDIPTSEILLRVRSIYEVPCEEICFDGFDF